MRRSETSKYKKLTELKRIARSFGWGYVKETNGTGGDSESDGDDDPWFSQCYDFCFQLAL